MLLRLRQESLITFLQPRLSIADQATNHSIIAAIIHDGALRANFVIAGKLQGR